MESGGRFFGSKGGGGKSSQVLEHNDLYNAYPDLGNINTSYNFQAPKHSGTYNESANFIQVDAPMGYQSAKDTTLHELQHAIQQREGWAKGGSPADFEPEQIVNDARVIAARLMRGEKPSEAAKWFSESLGRTPSHRSIDLAMTEPKKLFEYPSNPDVGYKRLAGEAEARLTQARMGMNMDERLASYPYDMLDVPIDQLIVRGLLGK
jgi:hypothetical protein